MIKKVSEILALFASVSTLICCALPAVFVMLGAGAVFASITQSFPQLIWISMHKNILFLVAGALLFINWRVLNNRRSIQCHAKNQDACESTKSFSRFIWIISMIAYIVGAFMAYVLPALIY